ncbi:M28 family peptidase [Hymenobacter mucosus]|uniref:Zn-dependent amino- or carboxypeptidase, M28 family n=1 Tax=Hymenobacter mucosus TaxID=1411120 RepID=A0A238XZ07_9BACT|nr:M28 family peptidase [Hymenobacter mucosus]SNR64117.1 Zn-dependent amino- or carboxypeptidase, M28 family [Hymenobacter mucosus]
MKCSPLLLLAALGSAWLTSPATAQAPLPKPVTKALDRVRPGDVKAHIWYLADDRLRGRQPGTPGYQMAVDYVTTQLRQLGVQPAGEAGTFVQRVRLRRATTQPGATLTHQDQGSTTARPFTYATDFLLNPHPEQAAVTVEAPVVFAGYGISAPELGYDDYAGLDAKGKLVVVVRGAPARFPSTVAAASQDLGMTLQNAVRHGAVGVLVAATAAPATPPSATARRSTNSVLGPDGRVAASRTYAPGSSLQVVGNVGAAAFNDLLRTASLDTGRVLPSLRRGTPASAPLATTLRASYQSSYHDFDSYNVVGKVEGSDPTLRNEYVVHSAHLDHLGVGTPVQGDSIYNGAHDNASGVASVLEIARIYSRIKQKPRRSVLFVLQTGEELGLLGSGYFAAFPTVPKASLVADVNTDMPTIIAPLLSVVPLGAQHSSLSQPVNQAAHYLGLSVENDPEPDQNRFIRSDQYSFVLQGIPALHIKYGNRTADGRNNLDETVKKWRATTYHKPQDGTNGVFDFEAGRKYVQLNFLIGYLIAQETKRPTWNTGDFFGRQFGQAQ